MIKNAESQLRSDQEANDDDDNDDDQMEMEQPWDAGSSIQTSESGGSESKDDRFPEGNDDDASDPNDGKGRAAMNVDEQAEIMAEYFNKQGWAAMDLDDQIRLLAETIPAETKDLDLKRVRQTRAPAQAPAQAQTRDQARARAQVQETDPQMDIDNVRNYLNNLSRFVELDPQQELGPEPHLSIFSKLTRKAIENYKAKRYENLQSILDRYPHKVYKKTIKKRLDKILKVSIEKGRVFFGINEINFHLVESADDGDEGAVEDDDADGDGAADEVKDAVSQFEMFDIQVHHMYFEVINYEFNNIPNDIQRPNGNLKYLLIQGRNKDVENAMLAHTENILRQYGFQSTSLIRNFKEDLRHINVTQNPYAYTARTWVPSIVMAYFGAHPLQLMGGMFPTFGLSLKSFLPSIPSTQAILGFFTSYGLYVLGAYIAYMAYRCARAFYSGISLRDEFHVQASYASSVMSFVAQPFLLFFNGIIEQVQDFMKANEKERFIHVAVALFLAALILGSNTSQTWATNALFSCAAQVLIAIKELIQKGTIKGLLPLLWKIAKQFVGKIQRQTWMEWMDEFGKMFAQLDIARMIEAMLGPAASKTMRGYRYSSLVYNILNFIPKQFNYQLPSFGCPSFKFGNAFADILVLRDLFKHIFPSSVLNIFSHIVDDTILGDALKCNTTVQTGGVGAVSQFFTNLVDLGTDGCLKLAAWMSATGDDGDGSESGGSESKDGKGWASMSDDRRLRHLMRAQTLAELAARQSVRDQASTASDMIPQAGPAGPADPARPARSARLAGPARSARPAGRADPARPAGPARPRPNIPIRFDHNPSWVAFCYAWFWAKTTWLYLLRKFSIRDVVPGAKRVVNGGMEYVSKNAVREWIKIKKAASTVAAETGQLMDSATAAVESTAISAARTTRQMASHAIAPVGHAIAPVVWGAAVAPAMMLESTLTWTQEAARVYLKNRTTSRREKVCDSQAKTTWNEQYSRKILTLFTITDDDDASNAQSSTSQMGDKQIRIVKQGERDFDNLLKVYRKQFIDRYNKLCVEFMHENKTISGYEGKFDEIINDVLSTTYKIQGTFQCEICKGTKISIRYMDSITLPEHKSGSGSAPGAGAAPRANSSLHHATLKGVCVDCRTQPKKEGPSAASSSDASQPENAASSSDASDKSWGDCPICRDPMLKMKENEIANSAAVDSTIPHGKREVVSVSEDSKKVVITNCEHKYHEGCLIKMLIQSKPICAICRRPYTGHTFVYIK